MSDNNTLRIIEAKKVKELIKEKKRIDDRNFFDLREIEIKRNVIHSADGSVWLKLGDTEIMAGVKLEVGTPYADNPDEGSMIFNLELSTIANPDYDTGPPKMDAIEFGRVADRAIRSAELIDFKKLGLVSGEKSFLIFIDCYALNADGNLIDAAQMAAMVALLETNLVKLDENYNVIKKDYSDEKLPIDVSKIPISFTFEKIGEQIILDACEAEEDSSDSRLSIGVFDNKIVSFHKGKFNTFTIKEVEEMIDIALSKYNEIKNKICDVK